MNPEEFEAILNEIRENHEDVAVVTEKLQKAREGFSTVVAEREDFNTKLTETQEKYLSAVEVNGRLHNQLSFQKKDEDPDPQDPPKPKTVSELFKPEVLQNQ